MSSDYDDFVDELPVLGDEEWGALLSGAAGSTTATAITTQAEPSSTGPGTHNLNANTSGAPAEPPPQTVQDGAASDTESTDYGDDDIFDSTFLQAVDALERGLTQAESGMHIVAFKLSRISDSLSRLCSTSYYYAAREWP